MADYLFYTYFESGREYFVYKDLTFERSHKNKKDFPFLESLLRLTYLDIWPMENLFKEMDKALLNFCCDGYSGRTCEETHLFRVSTSRLAVTVQQCGAPS